MSEKSFKVGDLVTRDGSDVQRVTEANDGYGNITVVCIKEPRGYLNENGTRDAPWCKLGEEERNLEGRYTYAGNVIEGVAFEVRSLPTHAGEIKLECLGCKRSMGYDRSTDPSIPTNVVRITQPHCDECWDGDREGETWYDASGSEVDQQPAADAVRLAKSTPQQALPG